MGNGQRVTFETTLSEPDDDGPARLYVWMRHFEGNEELTGRYEVFEDLPRLDEFIARTAASGEDTAVLQAAARGFRHDFGPGDLIPAAR